MTLDNTVKRPLRIGLTYTGTAEKHQDYANWIKGADAIEVIQLDAGSDNAAAVSKLDAVVLSGGIDLHPKNYGSPITEYANAPETFNEARDRFETQVFVLSQQYQKPLLGICRGMQLLNCIFGGSLTQDLGEDGNSIHRNTGTDKRHPLTIKDGSMLQQLAGLSTTDTNSAHHQSIDRLGHGLRVSALSPDGIIEAVEWSDPANKPYLLGVQWHPERMYKINMQDSVLSTHVRSHFLNAVQQYVFGDKAGDNII